MLDLQPPRHTSTLRNPAACLNVARLKVSREPNVSLNVLDDEAHRCISGLGDDPYLRSF